MSRNENSIVFQKRDFKGSRFRCLLLTNGDKETIASFISDMVKPYAKLSPTDVWLPRGFIEPEEAKLGETTNILKKELRNELTDWWLEIPGRANTPNWDLVSTCLIDEKPGLIIVEAKAHKSEFSDDRCGATNQRNYQRIKVALNEANEALCALVPGFSLSADSFYQLSNRFAFAWKLVSMGVPVVLVYLGFINAHEMEDPFKSDIEWREHVLSRSRAIIPEKAWNRTFNVNGIKLTVLIRAACVDINGSICLGAEK